MIKLQREYDELAQMYEKNRGIFDMSGILSSYWNFLECPSGKLLDLGCGAGEPVARWFIDRNWLVEGIDYSRKMLELAGKYAPEMKVYYADMREIGLADHLYDGITAVYSLFHLPIPDQIKMFAKISRWLKPGGKFLFTYATKEYTGLEEFSGFKDFMGQNLFYSHTTPLKLEKQLTAANLEICSQKYLEIGGETFLWVIAESTKLN
jgi:ubiquinone/menaquinone biosynthesis C-methylase UbiE